MPPESDTVPVEPVTPETPPPASDSAPPAKQESSQTPAPVQTPNPTAGDKAGTPAPEAKFTQAEVDRIAADRAKHAKSAERAALLKELGVENVEAAKTTLQAAEEARRAQLSETERLKLESAENARKASEAEAARVKAVSERQAALLEAEVVSKASGKFADPKAAVKLADLTGVTFEDGKFSGVDEALEKLAQTSPWALVKEGTAPAHPTIGATNPKKPAKDGKANTDEEMLDTFFGAGGRRTVFQPRPDGVRLNK